MNQQTYTPPKPLQETITENKLVFTSEASDKEDWFLCTLSRESGFSMFKEVIRKDKIKEWILQQINFMNGGKKWVK